jgi:hypothetical protein
MNRNGRAVFLARAGLAMLGCLACSTQWELRAAPAPFQMPTDTSDQTVTVTGRLELLGDNYFLDPRFALVDAQNNRVVIASWAPLEIPPSPPGGAGPAVRGSVMQDYLNRELSVVGVYRSAIAAGGDGSQSPAAPSDRYLDAQSVTDVQSGQTVFRAPSTSGVQPGVIPGSRAGGERRQGVTPDSRDPQPTNPPQALPAGSSQGPAALSQPGGVRGRTTPTSAPSVAGPTGAPVPAAPERK